MLAFKALKKGWNKVQSRKPTPRELDPNAGIRFKLHCMFLLNTVWWILISQGPRRESSVNQDIIAVFLNLDF